MSTLLLLSSYASAAPHSKTILVLGDSLSAEYGLQRGTGWVALLEKRLQDKKMDTKVLNASISGETSSGGLTRLPALLQQHHPDIVIIELGGNDALRGFNLDASEKNFREMIRLSKQNKARVLLTGMRIPPNYGKPYSDRFFAMYGKIAHDTNSALLPFLLEGRADQPELFQGDRIHLIAQAHPRILDNVWAPLQNLLNQTRSAQP